ncbi:hypothetical protein HQ489_02395 [Candidatus Woesearchaeota archaeon]|nr:hypothetical protein [Candidatus Woesearchaeota archaeon]
MIISFFEEYPTKENLQKLELIDWPTKLYIGAKSLKEFNHIKSTINNKYVKEIVWWILLENHEGYWFSPFTKKSALQRVFQEANDAKDIPIMIDAEYPLRHSPWLFFTQLPSFFNNRKLIRNFIKKHNNIYVAEYFLEGLLKDKWMHFMGMHFDANIYNCKTMKMIYHSMLPYLKGHITQKFERAKKLYGNKYIPGYGTIATGVLGNEPILKVKQLEKDLQHAQDADLKEVVIFRLGGLNEEYKNVIKKII